LKIGPDMLLIITSTGDLIFNNINIGNQEITLNPKNKGF